MSGMAQQKNDRTHVGVIAVLAMTGVLLSTPLRAETKGFVVNYFHIATHSDERNCPEGGNGAAAELKLRALEMGNYSQSEIKELLNLQDAAAEAELDRIKRHRGRIDGEPANINFYPMSAPYQRLETVAGPYAYGFDLDASGPLGDSNSFEDPETGQRGIDNQLFRIVGCYNAYDLSYPTRPWYEELWGNDRAVETKAPVWLFAISGENLGQDGNATVSFYKGVGHLRHDNLRHGLANMTYVVDPSPRNYGTFRGTIRNGVFLSSPYNVSMELEGGYPNYLRVALSKAQLRLDLKQSSAVAGYLGGYQPWMDLWFYFGLVGDGLLVDVAETYHAFKHFADAEPDPKTGENTAISTTYRIDAVPAFLARLDGTFITDSH